MKIKNLIFIFFFILTVCKSPQIYKNFSDYKKIQEVAIVEFDGYLLKLQDNTNEFYDILILLEGKYLIEFKDRRTFMKGAALCNLKADKVYTIKIIDRKEFPKQNKMIYIGDCQEVDKKETNVIEKYFLEKKL